MSELHNKCSTPVLLVAPDSRCVCCLFILAEVEKVEADKGLEDANAALKLIRKRKSPEKGKAAAEEESASPAAEGQESTIKKAKK
jgi:hypothetical protein